MDMLHIFGSQCKSNEILFLLEDIKPVVRHGYYDHEIKKVEEFCKEKGLFLVKSVFKVIPSETGYSNKGVLSKDGMAFAYISKDERTANLASYYEIRQDHINLGLTLGYPLCCSRFFSEQFPIRSKLDNNYDNPVIENSRGKRFPFQNNIFMRSEDICLLSHFPCHLGCPESKRIGNLYLEAIRKADPDLAAIIMNRLKMKHKGIEFA